MDVCEGPDVAQFGDTVDRLFTTTFTVDPALRAGAAAGRPEARLARVAQDGAKTELGRGARPWPQTLTVAPRDIALLVLE